MGYKKRLAKGLAVGLLVACGTKPTVHHTPHFVAGEGHQPLTVPHTASYDACARDHFTQSPVKPFIGDLSHHLSAHSHHHGGGDVITLPGAPAELTAWFDYSMFMQPLAGEQIRLFTQNCPDESGNSPDASNASEGTDNSEGNSGSGMATWILQAESKTDASGSVTFYVDPGSSHAAKINAIFEVAGDGTQAQAALYILPQETHFVVFDIDGTLSLNNRSFLEEIAEQMAHRTVYPQAFNGAVALTHAWRDKGYVPLYLSNRPHQLADITRAWLTAEGFAEGPLLMSRSINDLLPNNGGAGSYKLATLRSLQKCGYSLDFAYGNESTDIYAYNRAGLPAEHTFSIGTHAGIAGSQPIFGDYTTHLLFVTMQPQLNNL